jgi:hypothetical protein
MNKAASAKRCETQSIVSESILGVHEQAQRLGIVNITHVITDVSRTQLNIGACNFRRTKVLVSSRSRHNILHHKVGKTAH